MKAIKINNEIRFQNSFQTFGKSIGFKHATEKQLYDWGFREVIIPEITQYQRLGRIYFKEFIQLTGGTTTGNYFTYQVQDFTQLEMDIIEDDELDSDESALLEDKYEKDGLLAYKRIKNRIRRAKDTNHITKNQFNTIRRFIRPAILPITTGDWDIAKENLDSLSEPNNVKLLNILKIVKDIVDNYIIDNEI